MLSAVVWGKLKGIKVLIVDVYSTKAFWYAYCVSELGYRLNIPLMLVLHGGKLPQRFKISPKLTSRLIHNASVIVSPSGYLKHHTENLSSKSVRVIANPLCLNNYPLLEKEFIHINLLWVRSFHHIYNPEMAVKVCKLLQKSWSEVKLTMIGPDKDGSLEKVRKMAEGDGLLGQINFKGLMLKNDWIRESAKANLFINTSSADNMPVSVLEALALGIPVVSTNVGGIPYMLQDGETALLVHEGDAEAMANAIIRIMTDSALREKLIFQGRKLAEQMDLQHISEKWKALIHEVVS
jgi:glycosyltransferase involved in cell wall biosynthesis